MKGVSNIIALLIVVGIAIALAVVVSNIALSQISRTAQQPRHILVTNKEVARLGPASLKVKVSLYNPSNLDFTVCPSSVSVYTSGFRSVSYLSLVERPCIRVQPGETGKLEVVVTLQQQSSVSQGVVRIDLSISSSGGSYTDVVLIPLR